MKKLKDKSLYLTTAIVVILIFSILFYFKGIFPFGENTLIYGDMHDQITAFYYHLWDSFRGNSSLMIDFSTAGGINFIGILAYYILSPVSLIVLLFKREQIYLVVSIIISLKILFASLTCLYSIRALFNKKLSYFMSVALSISYAFCGYSILMYQITPWMDLLYLFPILVVGLKKTLDLEKPYMYIISLTLCMIFSFYVSYMMLIFIFFLALIYIINFVDKEKRKKSVTALGITTILAMCLSSFIVVPAFYQVSVSSRIEFDFGIVLNSKLGPITDKIEFFLLSPILVFPSIMLFFNKNSKKFMKWYVPSFLIVFIPYIIEPINKIFHFMSYAFFPSRYGFITFYLMTLGAAYYFISDDEKLLKIGLKKIISLFLVLLMTIGCSFISYIIYKDFQVSMFVLTISKNHKLFFIVLGMFIIQLTALLLMKLFNSKKSLYYQVLMLITSISIIALNSNLCFGLSEYKYTVIEPYLTLQKMKDVHNDKDFYRTKNASSSMVTNSGMVSSFYNLDHFTSLTDNESLKVLKKFGFSTYWTKTSSKNGTLFTDLLMGNKYFITRNTLSQDYYINRKSFVNHFMYELDMDVSFGYFVDNLSVYDYDSSFDLQNAIYSSISGNDDKLFEIYSDYELENVEIINEDGKIKLQIIDSSDDAYIKYHFDPDADEKVYYLELFKSYKNGDDANMYGAMDVYVNGKLLRSGFPLAVNNGILNLKNYKEQNIDIVLKLKKNIEVESFNVASVSLKKLSDFAIDNKVNTNIKYRKNNVDVHVHDGKGGLLFLPISYSDSYTVKVDGKKSELVKVFDGFIGVDITSGNHDITFSYVSPYLMEFGIFSFTMFIVSIFIFKLGLYEKIINNGLVNKIAYYTYMSLYLILLFIIYIVMFIAFVLSFIL